MFRVTPVLFAVGVRQVALASTVIRQFALKNSGNQVVARMIKKHSMGHISEWKQRGRDGRLPLLTDSLRLLRHLDW